MTEPDVDLGMVGYAHPTVLSSRASNGTFLVLGAYTLVIQVVLLRECFALFSGNELSVALQLGLWLGLTALGGLLGGVLQPRRWYPVLLVILPVAGISAPILVRVLPTLLPVASGATTPFAWALLALLGALAPCNLVAGALFPITCAVTGKPDDPSVIGRGYLHEALGAGLAGLLVTLVLSGRVRSIDLAVLASGAVAVRAAWMLRASLRRGRVLLWLPAALMLIAGPLGRTADLLDDWWWDRAHPGWRRLVTIESRYQRLDLAERQEQQTVLLNGLPALSYEPSFAANPSYRLADLFLGLHPDPRSVLVLGQGEPGLVTRLLEHPLERITYVVLDTALLAHNSHQLSAAAGDAPRPAAFSRLGILDVLTSTPAHPSGRKHHWARHLADFATKAGENCGPELSGVTAGPWSDPRLSVRPDDGRRFLRTTHERFDLIILDLPTPVSASSNRLFTVEAFRTAGGLLLRDGLLVLHLPSSGHYIGGETELVLAAIRRALEAAFPDCELYAGEEMVFAAGSGVDLPALPWVVQRLASRITPLSLPGVDEGTERELRAALFHALLEDYGNELRRSQQLQALDQLPVTANSDARPVAYSINLRRWLREIGMDVSTLERGQAMAERGVTELSRHWLPVTLVAGLLAAVLALPRSRQPLLAVAMLSSGWAGMAGELAIVLGFQNAFGTLYRSIGGLIAAYMLGLATGGLLGLRLGIRALPLLRLLMIGSCIAASQLPTWTPAPVYLLMLFGYALLLGIEYPVSNHLCCRESGQQRAAGLLHSADHLGAATATLLGGTLLLPLVGAATLLLSIACLHAVILVPLAITAFRRR